jgi:hypothetical protein
MNHGTLIALLVVIYFVLIATPIALLVLGWRGWKTTRAPSYWRAGMALASLSMESIGALAMPVIMILLSTHTWAKWIQRIEITAMDDAVIVGIAASLIAIPLAAFAWGKTRWLTLLACILTLALCYGTGISLSF